MCSSVLFLSLIDLYGLSVSLLIGPPVFKQRKMIGLFASRHRVLIGRHEFEICILIGCFVLPAIMGDSGKTSGRGQDVNPNQTNKRK